MQYLWSIFLIVFVIIDEKGSVMAQDCPENEIYTECSSDVEATCDVPDPFSDKMCHPPKCQCAEGFIRQQIDGPCIPRDECTQGEIMRRIRSASGKPRASPSTECSTTEKYTICGVETEPTCQFRNPTNERECGPSKCECREYHVRIMTGGPCIHEALCYRFAHYKIYKPYWDQ